jgi:HlyD family secretion protein
MQPVTVIPLQEKEPPKSFRKKVTSKIAKFFQKHPKKKIAALILVLVVLMIIVRAMGGQGQIVVVTTGEVVQEPFEKNVFASGKLEVKNKREFFADSKTTVKEILVKAGDKVTEGQIVLKTDDQSLAAEVWKNRLACDDIRSRLIKSESNLRLFQLNYELALKEYENAEILYESGAVSKKELEDAEKKLTETRETLTVERDANLPLLKSQLAQAEQVYADSEEKLQKAAVVSPMDGVVLNLPVKTGQEVEAGALLAQIGNPNDLQLETGINEIDAAQLKPGITVEITNKALLAQR